MDLVPPTSDMPVTAFLICAGVLGALGLITWMASIAALRRRRPGRFMSRLVTGTLLMTLGALAAAVAVGIRGYRALTREEVAARLTVRPTTPQHFNVVVHLPDGRDTSFAVAGDEIYVDANILKWKPVANLLGLHTVYELDRLGGRYRSLEQEQSGERTVYSLGADRFVDLFSLRQRYVALGWLLDTEYGSGTFVTVNRPAELEVRVSTTGLLMREAAASK